MTLLRHQHLIGTCTVGPSERYTTCDISFGGKHGHIRAVTVKYPSVLQIWAHNSPMLICILLQENKLYQKNIKYL